MPLAADGEARRPAIEWNGGGAWLDPDDPQTPANLHVLAKRWEHARPVSMLVDPAGRLLDARVPLIVKVRAFTQFPNGDWDVTLQPSHAVHVLRNDHPECARLLAVLAAALERRSTVAVTETPVGNDIIDISPLGHFLFDPLDFGGRIVQAPPPLDRDRWSILDSAQEAHRLFLALQREGCDRRTRACIPFAYVKDGCTARAHRMCELMLERGVRPGKVWLFGRLRVPTSSYPASDCVVPWKYHVAPVVQVRVGGRIELFAIDPALFKRQAVPVERWKRRQRAAHLDEQLSEPELWDQPPDGEIVVDSDFSLTPAGLAEYQDQLGEQIREAGPPPYCDD
ncbi:MAG: hypothetical protein FJW14_13010 [Acidimicrobiia bacterium]|nr:hypothetical protein [Acidimicrobiia bacterium]